MQLKWRAMSLRYSNDLRTTGWFAIIRGTQALRHETTILYWLRHVSSAGATSFNKNEVLKQKWTITYYTHLPRHSDWPLSKRLVNFFRIHIWWKYRLMERFESKIIHCTDTNSFDKLYFSTQTTANRWKHDAMFQLRKSWQILGWRDDESNKCRSASSNSRRWHIRVNLE